MRFQWTDALRLTALYALGYLAIAALAVAAYRQWGEAEREIIELSAAAAAIAFGLTAQRNVLSACTSGRIGFWQWWGAFIFGLTLMAATFGLIVLVWTVAENSGTPLSTWLIEVAGPTIDRWMTLIDGPISNPASWVPNAVFAAVLFPVILLIYWPLAGLLKRHIGQSARPYLFAVFIAAIVNDTAVRSAEDFAARLTTGFPDEAFWASLMAAAGVLGIIEAAILSIAFFAMSVPKTPAGKSPPPKPDTPAP